jgi:hypothetical protein
MSDSMAAERVAFAGTLGPETLRIPAEPTRLTQAAQQLRELADSLGSAGDELVGAEGRHQERDGSTTSTVLGVARWNGNRLRKDAALLHELAEVTDHEAQLLGDVQAHDLPSLRRRWDQARGDLLASTRGAADAAAQGQQGQQGQHAQHAGGGASQQGGGGHGAAWEPQHPAPAPDAHAVMQHVDEQQVQEYADLFARVLGQQLPHGGGGGESIGTNLDARTEQAVSSYRQSVRGILDEFASIVQRVQQAERQVDERATFPSADRDDDEGSAAVMVAGGLVSTYPVLRELSKDLRAGAQAHAHASESIVRISQSLRDGQLPDRSRPHEAGEGFRQEWQRHLDRRHLRLQTVSEKVDDVLDRFQRLDEECARAIRSR